MRKRTVRDVDVAGRTVLVRADLNVPLADGRVADDTRIGAALPTLAYLLERGCPVVLCSHLGRPKGRPVPELRLDPVAERLRELLGVTVHKAEDVTGPDARRLRQRLQPGEVLLLENLRFDPREEQNDPGFAGELAAFADLFVQDAFGAVHRAHASTVEVARRLPAAAGLLLSRELEVLGRLLTEPARPFWAVIGGAKVSDKLGVLRRLLAVCDGLVIGGGMANTFLLAQGLGVGRSLCEPGLAAEARAILEEAERRGVRVLLPVDAVVAERPEPGVAHRVVPVDAIPPDAMVLDVGPATAARFREVLADAGTVFWNGPMGVFEVPPFDRGTVEVARALADSRAVTVVGGGDSVAAIRRAGVEDRIDHVSTGGGAALELLEGRELPGIAVLPDAGA